MTRWLLLALTLSACGSSEHEESLGPMAFAMPASWHRSDTHGGQNVTAVFDPAQNANKESITVIYAQLGPIATKYSPALLGQLLAGSQTSLSGVHSSPPRAFQTSQGFHGMRVELDYVPPGLTQHYHRVHAVFARGNAIVHVLYTAATVGELTTFEKVLDTLHEES